MKNAANTQFAVGVHAMVLLSASPDIKQSSEVLAGSIGSNPVHVRRVMAHLRSAGLVESRPGIGGGWRLLRDPEDVTLTDVWRAVRASDRVLGVHLANPDCVAGQSIQREMESIDDRTVIAIERELSATTLAELVAAADTSELHSPVGVFA